MTHTTESRVKKALYGSESDRHELFNDLRPFIANIMTSMGLFGPTTNVVSWKIFEYAVKSFDPFRRVGFETYFGFCLKRSAPRMVKMEMLKDSPESEIQADPHDVAEIIRFNDIDIDDRISLEMAIMGLPEDEQTIFLLRMAGYSFKDIAVMSGINRSSVSRIFNNAVGILTSEMRVL